MQSKRVLSKRVRSKRVRSKRVGAKGHGAKGCRLPQTSIHSDHRQRGILINNSRNNSLLLIKANSLIKGGKARGYQKHKLQRQFQHQASKRNLRDNSLPPHLYYPCVPACYEDNWSNHSVVVDRHHTHLLLDLHSYRTQLESDDFYTLRQEVAGRYYTINTLDYYRSSDSDHASANSMESAPSPAAEG